MELQAAISKFERLIAETLEYFSTTDVSVLEEKTAPDKWPKREILDHLADSSIHNLVRFTKINHAEKPYAFRTCSQNVRRKPVRLTLTGNKSTI